MLREPIVQEADNAKDRPALNADLSIGGATNCGMLDVYVIWTLMPNLLLAALLMHYVQQSKKKKVLSSC